MEQYKTCTKCGQSKLILDFRKHAGKADGLDNMCKACKAITDANYYQKNKLKIKQRVKNQWPDYYAKNKNTIKQKQAIYRANNRSKINLAAKLSILKNPEIAINAQHRRRARLKGNGIYLVKITELKKLLSKSCFYCGKKSEHIDHVIPISRGGKHSIGNLVPSCGACNSSKGNKTIMEWRIWKMRLSGSPL